MSTTVDFQTGLNSYDGERDCVMYDFSGNEHIEQSPFYGARANRYALWYFDLTSIPTSATVTAVTFDLYITETNNGGGNIGLYKLTDPDGTGAGSSYTWLNTSNDVFNSHATYQKKIHESGVNWNSGGGVITDVASLIQYNDSGAISIFYSGHLYFTDSALVTCVQDWVSNPSNNLGFLTIPGNLGDPTSGTGGYLDVTQDKRPKLTVTYSSGTLEQEGFRWRNDDGSETGATWLASQDSNATEPISTKVRLRTIINSTGDTGSTQYQLEYRLVTSGGGGTWQKVT